MFQLKFDLAGGLFGFNQMSVGFGHGLFNGLAVIGNRLVKRRDGRTGRVIEICDQRAGLPPVFGQMLFNQFTGIIHQARQIGSDAPLRLGQQGQLHRKTVVRPDAPFI